MVQKVVAERMCTQMNDMDRLQKLFEDEAFVKEFLSQETAADAQLLLERYGVEMSVAELEAVGEVIRKYASGEISAEQLENAASGELSEEELEQVAGGAVVTMSLLAFASIVIGSCAAGGATGAVLASVFGKW